MSQSSASIAPLSFPSPSAPRAVAGRVTTPLSFLGATLVKRVRAGETLYAEGESGRYCYEIIDGVLKEYATLEDGRREISDFYCDRDLVGISDDGSQMQTGEAVTDCAVRCIPQETLLREARHSAEVSAYLFELMMGRLRRAHKHSTLIARKSAMERVATFLLEFAEKQSSAAEFSIPMSRQDIGDHLGLTIETVCRTLTELKRRSVISMRAARSCRIENLAALRRAAGEDANLN